MRRYAANILVCACGVGLQLAAFFPGYMSVDSSDQLQQAVQNQYTDLHPPFMAWLWHQLLQFVPGPTGMLVLQAVLLWAGSSWLFTAYLPPALAALAALAVCAWPAVFALSGTIWKDILLGGVLISTCAAIAHKRRWLALGLLLLAAACRHNAIVALPPLCFLLASSATKRWVMAGSGLTVATALGASLVSSVLTHGKSTHPVQQIWSHDLTAIAATTGDDTFPVWVSAEQKQRAVMAYQQYPWSVCPLLTWQDSPLQMQTGASEIQELRRGWLQHIARHPATYLKHRWGVFSDLLGIDNRSSYVFHNGVRDNPAEWPVKRTRFAIWTAETIEHYTYTIFFDGWLYVALAIVSCVVSIVKRNRDSLAIASSGLIYALTYFFVATNLDFRFLWWTVLSALISIVILFSEATRRVR